VTEKKKKSEAAVAEKKENLPLTQLLLDCPKDKYRLVSLAIRWAQEVKKRDQSTEAPVEVVNKSLKEILSDQVKLDDIEKLPPVPKTEKKPDLIPLTPKPEDKPEEAPKKGE